MPLERLWQPTPNCTTANFGPANGLGSIPPNDAIGVREGRIGTTSTFRRLQPAILAGLPSRGFQCRNTAFGSARTTRDLRQRSVVFWRDDRTVCGLGREFGPIEPKAHHDAVTASTPSPAARGSSTLLSNHQLASAAMIGTRTTSDQSDQRRCSNTPPKLTRPQNASAVGAASTHSDAPLTVRIVTDSTSTAVNCRKTYSSNPRVPACGI